MGGCCSQDSKRHKRDMKNYDPDKKPNIREDSIGSQSQSQITEQDSIGYNNTNISDIGGEEYDSEPSQTENSESRSRKSKSKSNSYDKNNINNINKTSISSFDTRESLIPPNNPSTRQHKTKTIVTDFGFSVGIELDDIASFLDDIKATDLKREKQNNKKKKYDGMDRIWLGCVGGSGKDSTPGNNNTSKNSKVESIQTTNQLNRLLYKLTYVTLNTYNKSKNNKNLHKTKPDKKAVEGALIPIKQSILLLKFNTKCDKTDEQLNGNITLTRQEFKENFATYLRKASEIMQADE